MITAAELREQLRELGVRRGGVLLVHTSFRAVGAVEGGPLGLIAALGDVLGAEGTLVMPTMTDGRQVFDPATTPSVDMGVVAELFWRQPGVLRSTHPGASFAARGPHAAAITAVQPLEPPHGHDSPVGRVFDLEGQVLLLGVHHSESTTVHLAESLAGVPYSIAHPCVVDGSAGPRTVEIAEPDHCCMGFRKLDEWLDERGLQQRGLVGRAECRLANSSAIVEVAREHLGANPLVFLCAQGVGCDECDRARRSIRA